MYEEEEVILTKEQLELQLKRKSKIEHINVFTTPITECLMCRDNIEILPVVKVEPCNHIFHTACMAGWAHQLLSINKDLTCPMCRRTIEAVTYIADDNSRDLRYTIAEYMLEYNRLINISITKDNIELLMHQWQLANYTVAGSATAGQLATAATEELTRRERIVPLRGALLVRERQQRPQRQEWPRGAPQPTQGALDNQQHIKFRRLLRNIFLTVMGHIVIYNLTNSLGSYLNGGGNKSKKHNKSKKSKKSRKSKKSKKSRKHRKPRKH